MFGRAMAVALACSTIATAPPAAAQTDAADVRFRAAQDRFDREYRIYREEVDRYRASLRLDQGYPYPPAPVPAPRIPDPRYDGPATGYDADDRDDADYDAALYYRSGGGYQERVLANEDRVYRGRDGRYYCRRNDGTTGLIVGAAAGGILGNVIDGGRSRVVGTLLGGAAGAIAGKAIDQNDREIRCR